MTERTQPLTAEELAELKKPEYQDANPWGSRGFSHREKWVSAQRLLSTLADRDAQIAALQSAAPHTPPAPDGVEELARILWDRANPISDENWAALPEKDRYEYGDHVTGKADYLADARAILAAGYRKPSPASGDAMDDNALRHAAVNWLVANGLNYWSERLTSLMDFVTSDRAATERRVRQECEQLADSMALYTGVDVAAAIRAGGQK